MHTAGRQQALIMLLVGTLLTLGLFPCPAASFDWVPSDEEIQKYRKSWNPFSHGPVLLQSVDIQPKGQLSVREFLFSQLGDSSFGNQLTFASDATSGPVRLAQLNPSINAAYGLTNHLELGAAISVNAFWAESNGVKTNNVGLGDTSLILKYRPIVQNPDSWRPSLTNMMQLVLPTSQWAGTERPPGGFSPLGRLPNTRFGSLGFSEGLMTRKNLEPFRISAAVFYTYSAPGDDAGKTTYSADLVNVRLVVEHILDDKKGFGYNIELSTLSGLPWRVDGQPINSGQKNGFSIIGVEPALQWKFGDHWVASAGCLFTVAGQNAINAIYPNISLYWYWSQSGKVIMR